MSDSGIRDNHKRGTVADFLREKIVDGSSLSVVSAYFTIYAFEQLKDPLSSIHDLRFLFGEPRFINSLDPSKTEKKAFVIDADGLRLANKLELKRVARDCAEWIREKVEIKSVKQTNLLHGKMYHIANGGVEDAILGSSNFTVRGLGLAAANNNIELNLEVDSGRDRRDLKSWFDEFWNNDELIENVKEQVLEYLGKLYQNHAPEFIYFKTLYHIFERFLDEQDKGGLIDENIKIVDTKIWNALFEFQKDGVKGAINKILKHNGCVIADSVGLGKTFEALAIIKYFELLNERVLVLCPKKLRDNWTVYQAQNNSALNPFLADRFGYTVLSHTDLSRAEGKSGDIDLSTFHWGNFDLVVIDESHNFRNNTKGRRDEDGNIVRKSRYDRLMDDILTSGVKTKVLLLSATPVNNNLKDLRNQLYFITENKNDAFKDTIGVDDLSETLRLAQVEFSRWAKEKREDRRTSVLLERLSSGFFKLLDELTIARSRRHILKYYKNAIAELGGFPKRLRPESIYPDIDLEGKFLSYDKLFDEISAYKLSLFNPTLYLREEFRSHYPEEKVKEFSQQKREFYLIAMMRVGFLKRLESSIKAFEITLSRTIEKVKDLENRIVRFQKVREGNPEFDFDEISPFDADDDELMDAFEIGKKFRYKFAHLRLDDWLADLQKDRSQLNLLYLVAKDVTQDRDAKLKILKERIETKVRTPTVTKTGTANRKVLVFTAFADTASYLYAAIKDWAVKDLHINIAMVSGGSVENKTTFGKNDFSNILTNFSPVSKHRSLISGMAQDGEIDLLIATDCISEGQNLQDCDYLVNYDIHWNPVRIIQRFGRIDRIGSINDTVQLVNFWPTPNLEKYVKLKNRVEARMALVDIAATLDDNLLQSEEIEDLITDDLRYRDRQLLRLKDEVLDLEDFNETVALNEFTLDDFRIELSKYIESNKKLLDDAPFGLYAVVPAPAEHKTITPGVIFCLKQQGVPEGTHEVNPLQPYFLVYVREDKQVRFGFAQPKQVLEVFRLLCSGKSSPYEELCTLFDHRTSEGHDMQLYSALLDSAVKSIAATFRKRVTLGLQSERSFVVPDVLNQAAESSDFELVTWLVISTP